jgi:UDP-N-acetylglucosamine 4,6-dehydratase
MRVIDLAKAMAPHLPTKVVGVRPGEKLHETMCPKDDSHLTIEFGDHFVIRPSITFFNPISYNENAKGEQGRAVTDGFEYHSGTNSHFLTVEELRQVNALCE